eukprot:CAMPEP_0179214714 /NCGR_PEP_ID=MMETSP0797-20121207/2475_1 /TAXON_ID=47934 /ORGANISM="Dinophysis acuminata, Strain DAEP01" /LENGTH=137 /DNA_ID=CAMNT_0020920789 /DNA_START=485 /DNA_END=899 /DNA_ORIENTATION=-
MFVRVMLTALTSVWPSLAGTLAFSGDTSTRLLSTPHVPEPWTSHAKPFALAYPAAASLGHRPASQGPWVSQTRPHAGGLAPSILVAVGFEHLLASPAFGSCLCGLVGQSPCPTNLVGAWIPFALHPDLLRRPVWYAP